MPERRPSIFRPTALRNYGAKEKRSADAPLAPPRTFIVISALFGVIVAGLLVALFAEFPVYTEAVGIVIERRAGDVQGHVEADVFLLLAGGAEDVAQGQRVLIDTGRGGFVLSGSIISLESGPAGPLFDRHPAALDDFRATQIKEPATVAFASLRLPATVMKPGDRVGSRYKVRIEIGSRRVISQLWRRISSYTDSRKMHRTAVALRRLV